MDILHDRHGVTMADPFCWSQLLDPMERSERWGTARSARPMSTGRCLVRWPDWKRDKRTCQLEKRGQVPGFVWPGGQATRCGRKRLRTVKCADGPINSEDMKRCLFTMR